MKSLLRERGSEHVDELWDASARTLTAGTTYVETRAALGAARRNRRLSDRGLDRAKRELDARWQEISVIELEASLAAAAADLCERFALRAGNGIQLAAALSIDDPELVLATWDARLRDAAWAAGLVVAP